MIYKVFIRKQKTATLVVKQRMHFISILMHQMNAKDASKLVNWLKQNTDFNIEFITPLSEQHLAYEKESGALN